MRSLIDIAELSTDEIQELLACAQDIIANPVKYQDACAHKKLINEFSYTAFISC